MQSGRLSYRQLVVLLTTLLQKHVTINLGLKPGIYDRYTRAGRSVRTVCRSVFSEAAT